MKKLILFLQITLYLFLLGCGYHIGERSTLFKKGDTIFIEVFKNRTFESGIEEYITRDLIKEFADIAYPKVVSTQSATFRLSGEILSFGSYPIATDPNSKAVQYRIKVKVLIKLERGKKLILKREVERTEEYLCGYLVQDTEINRENAIKKLSEDMAQDIKDVFLNIF